MVELGKAAVRKKYFALIIQYRICWNWLGWFATFLELDWGVHITVFGSMYGAKGGLQKNTFQIWDIVQKIETFPPTPPNWDVPSLK